MIERIISIKGVARLNNVSATKRTFKPLTLIYGENGRGKSTLTCILRSLKTGDCGIVSTRKTNNSGNDPYVKLRANNHDFEFNSSWNKQLPNIEIFDTQFIYENVVTGNRTSIDHNRNLVNVVFGQENVELNRQINVLDEQIKTVNSTKLTKEREIKLHIKSGLSLQEFLNLEPEEQIEEQIETLKSEIIGIQNKSPIIKTSDFTEIDLPKVPLEELQELLQKSLETLEQDVETTIQAHLEGYHHIDERWLEKGTLNIGDTCPFCEQLLGESSLVKAYQSYFSEGYKTLKQEVEQFRLKLVKTVFPPTTLTSAISSLNTNMELSPFWQSQVQSELPSLDESILQAIWNSIREKTNEFVQEKQASPLEEVVLTDSFQETLQAYEELCETVVEYNEAVRIANEIIQAKKLELGGGDLEQKQTELKYAEDTKHRFKTEIDELCRLYQGHLNDLDQKRRDKSDLQNELRNNANVLLSQYGKGVKYFLGLFGVDFSITMPDNLSYKGRQSNLDYSIKIHDVSMKTQDAFEHGLSEGDKGTLALAFFLARLKDMDLSNTIVVFDDPVSSLDHNRRRQTRDEILELTRTVKQMIVLSHDSSFLGDIWRHKNTEKDKTQTLEVRVVDEKYSNIVAWDIAEATKSAYLKNRDKLKNYLQNGGDKKDAARTISPLLEEYFEIRFPNCVKPHHSLGIIIHTIKTHCTDSSRKDKDLEIFEPKLPNLGKINDFTTDHRHGGSDEPSRGELKTYIEMAFDIIEGR